jgi:hypothetical protein
MGFFSRRHKRENAIPDSVNSAQEQALGSFANPEGQPVVGEPIAGQPGLDLQGLGLKDGLAALTQLGPMIQQAMASGNVQISQGQPQVIDMRGSGLREEILGIMGQHGIDPAGGTANQAVDAAAYGNMQQQIFEALAKHGVSPHPAATDPADYAQMQQELMQMLNKHGINPQSGWSAGGTQIPPADGTTQP